MADGTGGGAGRGQRAPFSPAPGLRPRGGCRVAPLLRQRGTPAPARGPAAGLSQAQGPPSPAQPRSPPPGLGQGPTRPRSPGRPGRPRPRGRVCLTTSPARAPQRRRGLSPAGARSPRQAGAGGERAAGKSEQVPAGAERGRGQEPWHRRRGRGCEYAAGPTLGFLSLFVRPA